MPADLLVSTLRKLHSVIEGTDRDDNLIGTAKDDVVYGYSGQDWLNGMGGNDVLFGGAGIDFLIGGLGDDTMYGGDGDDWLYATGGDDMLFGGTGIDVVSYKDATAGVFAIIDMGTVVRPPVGDADVFGDDIEGIEGSRFNDHLEGSDKPNYFFGNDGDDALNGRDGDDYLYGGAGNDKIYGGAGDFDEISGGSGMDTIFGGAGNSDWLTYASSSGAVEVTLGEDYATIGRGGDAEGDVLAPDIEGVGGSNYNDTLFGNSSDNFMAGFDGNDTLYGGGGRDEILGVGGNDTLFGGQGIDTLNGSVGNDWLFGGTGEDVLITGEGRDVVSFAPEQATSLDGNCFGAIDRVTDFDTNRDKIDLKDFGYSCLEDFYEAGGKIVGTATGTYIYFDGTGQGVFLENVSARTIDESDFVF